MRALNYDQTLKPYCQEVDVCTRVVSGLSGFGENRAKADVRTQQTKTDGRSRPLEARHTWVEDAVKASARQIAVRYQREQGLAPVFDLLPNIIRVINLHSFGRVPKSTTVGLGIRRDKPPSNAYTKFPVGGRHTTE